LIKSDHFEGKRRFIRDFDGLWILQRLLCQEASLKFRRKQLSLLHDLTGFDEYIFGEAAFGNDKYFVRRFVSSRDDMLAALMAFVVKSDLANAQEL